MRLKQILINLIKNALKFTIGGTVRILVAFDEIEDSIKIAIVDNGKGIKEEDLSKLFHLFGKLTRTAEMNHEGIGMGLMIC